MDDELTRIREKRMQEMREKMREPPKAVVTHVDETHFQEFIKTNQYAVVDFWAEWCGPCRRISPIMEELSMEFSGKVAFGKVNTDDNRNLAMQFNISAIRRSCSSQTGSSSKELLVHTQKMRSGRRSAGNSLSDEKSRRSGDFFYCGVRSFALSFAAMIKSFWVSPPAG